MDNKSTIEELKQRVAKFVDERNWSQFHNPKDLSIGMITEASELLEHFRFKSIEESEAMLRDPAKREQIEDEIADVFYYILAISRRYGIDISNIFNRKMGKNEAKYSVEKFKDSNKKYNE